MLLTQRLLTASLIDILAALTLLSSIRIGNAAPLLTKDMPVLVSRDTFTFDNSNQISPLPTTPTLKDSIRAMLLATGGPDMLNGLVLASPYHITDFGIDDDGLSNRALSDFVDHAFTGNGTDRTIDGWVDTYIDFLIETGNTCLPELQKQYAVFDQYNATLTSFGEAQTKLIQAFRKSPEGKNATNIAARIPGEMPLPALNMSVAVDWAAKTLSQKGPLSTKYNQTDFDAYKKLAQQEKILRPRDQDIDYANKMAVTGWTFKNSIDIYPGVFNVSMIIGGEPSSADAQFTPAWGATIVNATRIHDQDVKELRQRVTEDLHNSTFTPTSGEFATTSLPQPSSTRSSSASTAKASSSTPTLARTLASTTVVPASASHHVPRQQVAVHITGENSDVQSDSTSRTSSINEAVPTNLTDSAPSGTLSTTEAAPTNATDSAMSSNGTAGSDDSPVDDPSSDDPAADDPLSDMDDSISLQGNLMIVTLTEGAWSNGRDDYINWARQYRPTVFEKYFGTPGNWTGPLAKRSTHLVLVALSAAQNASVGSIEYFGQVVGQLPVLDAPVNVTDAATNSTSDAVPAVKLTKEGCPEWNTPPHRKPTKPSKHH